MVLSAYKQIRAQSVNVLGDVSEDNFDKAFAFLRPGASPSPPIPLHLCIPASNDWILTCCSVQ